MCNLMDKVFKPDSKEGHADAQKENEKSMKIMQKELGIKKEKKIKKR